MKIYLSILTLAFAIFWFNFNSIESIIKNKNSNKFIYGDYVRINYNFFAKAILYVKGVRHLPQSDTLHLFKDHTFSQRACKYNKNGTWTFENDTLYTIYNNASSQLKTTKYLYKDGKLKEIWPSKSYHVEFRLSVK